MLSDLSTPPLEDLLGLVCENYYRYFCRMKRQSESFNNAKQTALARKKELLAIKADVGKKASDDSTTCARVRVLEREFAKARSKRKRADVSFQITVCVLNEHPYPGMLDWVETNTGIPSDEIHQAQLHTYQGRDKLRHRLRDLGSSREMEKFWTDFKVEYPDVLFQQRLIGPESTEPKVAELVVRLESRLGHQPTGLQIAISISLDGQAFKTEEIGRLDRVR